jgi:DNA-binding transcriptional LysR family regulator
MQDLSLIRVFLEVAALKNFAGAARSLAMTPATVTRAVARLEAEFGQQLLVRTTRQVSLTSAGEVVTSRFRPLVAEFDLAGDEIKRANLPDQGRLRVNAPISLGLRLLPDLLDSFRLAYPNVALDVVLTDTLIDILADQCDLAIRVSQAPQDKSTIWRKVCDVPRRIVAAPWLLNRINLPKDPDNLPRDLCLSYGSGPHGETWDLRHGQKQRQVRAGTNVISDSGDLLYSLVERGNGIALLPDFIVDPGLARGDVVALLPDWTAAPLWLTLYYPPYLRLPPLVATFSDFFESHVLQHRSATDHK